MPHRPVTIFRCRDGMCLAGPERFTEMRGRSAAMIEWYSLYVEIYRVMTGRPPRFYHPFAAAGADAEGVARLGGQQRGSDLCDQPAFRGPTNLFDEMRCEKRDTDFKYKNICIHLFHSAGVILYNARGYLLGYERRKGKCTWTDYGGKRKGDETPWETAVRECKEEASIDISSCRLKHAPDVHSDSHAKHDSMFFSGWRQICNRLSICMRAL